MLAGVASTNVVLTAAAADALGRTRAVRGDDLTFVIGNGCCDSTAPFLFAAHMAGPADELVGEVEGVPVMLDAALAGLFEGYEVVIDVAPDPGGDSFCCETEVGRRCSMERVPAPR